MHREEGQVQANHHQPEVNLTKTLIHQLAGELGEPVVDGCKDSQGCSTKEHVVNMGHNKVGIGDLIVERYDCQRCTIQTANEEHRHKAEREKHRRLEANF